MVILSIIANLIYKEGKIELGQTISGKDKTVFSGKDNEILVVIFVFFLPLSLLNIFMIIEHFIE